MQWPGTTAVLEKAAAQECESAAESMNTGSLNTGSINAGSMNTGSMNTASLNTGMISQAPAGAEVTMADVLAGFGVPCQDDPELFFAEAPGDVELAKSLCQGCEARIACLAGAIERREPWGVWGGELFLRGEVVPFKRPRGRPRKSTVAA